MGSAELEVDQEANQDLAMESEWMVENGEGKEMDQVEWELVLNEHQNCPRCLPNHRAPPVE